MTVPNPSVKERQLGLYDSIQAGEAGWQRRAYDEYYSLVRRLLINALGPNAEVEDLIGDVFVAFLESATRIRSAEGLRSYMVSIAMNTVRRELRRRQRRRAWFAWEDSDSAAERVASVDDPKAKAALLQLSRILDQLNVDDHMVFVLHMVEKLPVIDVAESLNMSVSTVKRRLKRANERVLRRVSRNPLLADYVREKSEVFDV
jgi:RNA polymerase sigma factor (sigma-70 family)